MPAKRKASRRRGWWVAAVLTVVLGLSVYAWWFLGAASTPRVQDSLAAIRAAAESGRLPEAGARINRWIEANPKDGQAKLLSGLILATQGRTDDAIKALEAIPETDPMRGQAIGAIGEIAFRGRRARRAELACREAAARDPNAAEPRQRLIHLLSLQLRHGEARDVLWELFRASREPRILSSLIHNLSFHESDARGFTSEIDEFLAGTPNDPYLRRVKGLALMMRSQPADALPHLEAAAEALSNDPVGRFALAECLLALGRFQGDESILGPRPEQPADAARWLVFRGRLQEALGRPDDALKSLRDAVAANPRDREAHYRLGQFLNRTGQSEAGRSQLDRAKELQASYREFEKELDTILRKGPKADHGFESLGKLCRDAGLFSEARAWYELAASADPSSETARLALAELPDGIQPLPVALSRPVVRQGSTAEPLPVASAPKPAKDSAVLRFEDVSSRAGISYQYDCAARGDLYLGDTMGGGVGLIDYDRDGWLDIYFVNGCPLPYDPKAPPGKNRLYRNRRDGTFEDVTARAGASGQGYGMGCAVGDYDDDGHDDLFVTGLGRTVLYRNRGDGTFEDVTAKAGVGSDRWTTAAGFADLDNDGDLDLMVVTYVNADPSNVPDCRDATGRPLHCSPARFDGQPDLLFRNDGNGKFTDISRESGIDAAPDGRGLGMAILDLNGDGKLDIFVANDLSPDFLFLNQGGLKFEESGMSSGVALNGSGKATSSMGVVADDLNGDGLPDLFITNFLNEPDSLFRNLGNGLFVDATLGANLQAVGLIGTGFGVAAPDFNNDRHPDLFMKNGHADDQPWINTPMAQPPQAFLGKPEGRFEAVPESASPYLSRRVVGRGLAAGDLDNDGRLDLVIVHRDVPAVVLRNTTPGGKWIGLHLHGKRSGSIPYGAIVTCVADGRSQVRVLAAGTSYLSVHDPRIWFGLGTTTLVDSIKVRWPSGLEQTFRDLPAGTIFDLTEGEEKPKPARGTAPIAKTTKSG